MQTNDTWIKCQFSGVFHVFYTKIMRKIYRNRITIDCIYTVAHEKPKQKRFPCTLKFERKRCVAVNVFIWHDIHGRLFDFSRAVRFECGI